MNQLFLLIPAVEEGDAGQEIAYLKLLGKVKNEDVVGMFKKISASMKYIKGENVEMLYDVRRLRKLNRCLIENRKKEGNTDDMPQVEYLLLLLNDAASIQERGLGEHPIVVNGMQVEQGIVNAFMESGTQHNALLNKSAINNEEHPIEVEMSTGKTQQTPLVCNPADVYLWLVRNRYPARVIDVNYEKHSERTKLGKNGVAISPVTYSKEQLELFLERAVCAGEGLRELYFKDNERNKIVVFWDENLEQPSYHAFEIAADDLPEIQKIYKRGGRALIRRIEDVSKIEKG